MACDCPRHVIEAMGRWSTDMWRLYHRAHMDSLLDWSTRMGRAVVNPLEITAALARMEIPVEGGPGWTREHQSVADAQDFEE